MRIPDTLQGELRLDGFTIRVESHTNIASTAIFLLLGSIGLPGSTMMCAWLVLGSLPATPPVLLLLLALWSVSTWAVLVSLLALSHWLGSAVTLHITASQSLLVVEWRLWEASLRRVRLSPAAMLPVEHIQRQLGTLNHDDLWSHTLLLRTTERRRPLALSLGPGEARARWLQQRLEALRQPPSPPGTQAEIPPELRQLRARNEVT